MYHKFAVFVLSAFVLTAGSRYVNADVYIDLDGVIGTPEPTGSVLSGTTITLKAIFSLPEPAGPFDAIGMTMTHAGTATATFLVVKAGSLAGAGGGAPPATPSLDGISGGLVGPGTTLALGAAPIPGFVDCQATPLVVVQQDAFLAQLFLPCSRPTD